MDPQFSVPVVFDPGHQHDRQLGIGRLGELVAVPDADPSLQQLPLRAPSPPEASSTCLAPADDFPTALAELQLTELQVLHSRVTRQLDREYCTDPDGAHPVTLDRAEELLTELDTRQEFLDPPVIAGTDRRTAPAPARHDKHLDELFRRRSRSIGTVDVVDLGRLRPGEEIEIWRRDQRQCTGVVEQAVPALGVLWIHEAGDGYRRMLSVSDVVLRYRLRTEPR